MNVKPIKQTVDYSALAASTPINAQAAKDISAKGSEYVPSKKICCDHWDAPPQTVPVPRRLENLIGTKFGRFTVVGLLDPKSLKSKGAKWLCRCSCGAYSSRRSKAILNKENGGDRCEFCRHQWNLRRITRRLSGQDSEYSMAEKD